LEGAVLNYLKVLSLLIFHYKRLGKTMEAIRKDNRNPLKFEADTLECRCTSWLVLRYCRVNSQHLQQHNYSNITFLSYAKYRFS